MRVNNMPNRYIVPDPINHAMITATMIANMIHLFTDGSYGKYCLRNLHNSRWRVCSIHARSVLWQLRKCVISICTRDSSAYPCSRIFATFASCLAFAFLRHASYVAFICCVASSRVMGAYDMLSCVVLSRDIVLSRSDAKCVITLLVLGTSPFQNNGIYRH